MSDLKRHDPVSVIALVLSVLSLICTVWNTKINSRAQRQNAAPKIAVTNVSLTKLEPDVALIRYQIQNNGSLTASDVHSVVIFSAWDWRGKHLNDNPKTSYIDTLAIGPTIVSNDHLENSVGLLDTEDHSNVATYSALNQGANTVELAIRVAYSDSEGNRFVFCDFFQYDTLSKIFTKEGQCEASDWVTAERALHPDEVKFLGSYLSD